MASDIFLKQLGGIALAVFIIGTLGYVLSSLLFSLVDLDYEGFSIPFELLGPFYRAEEKICWRYPGGATFFAEMFMVLVWSGRILFTGFLAYSLSGKHPRTFRNLFIAVSLPVVLWLVPAGAVYQLIPESCMSVHGMYVGGRQLSWSEIEQVDMSTVRERTHWQSARDSQRTDYEVAVRTSSSGQFSNDIPPYAWSGYRVALVDYLARFAPHIRARELSIRRDRYRDAVPEVHREEFLQTPDSADLP